MQEKSQWYICTGKTTTACSGNECLEDIEMLQVLKKKIPYAVENYKYAVDFCFKTV